MVQNSRGRSIEVEEFRGFGDLGPAKYLVLNVAGMTRMTSFGVRQWLRAMDQLSKTLGEIFLLGCPTFFVETIIFLIVLWIFWQFIVPPIRKAMRERNDLIQQGIDAVNVDGGMQAWEAAGRPVSDGKGGVGTVI